MSKVVSIQSKRDALRAKTIGKIGSFKIESIEYDGETVYFRQPSLKQRQDLINGSKDSAGEFLFQTFLVKAVISQTYVDADCTELLFEQEDLEVLMDSAPASFIDTFATTITGLLNNEGDAKN